MRRTLLLLITLAAGCAGTGTAVPLTPTLSPQARRVRVGVSQPPPDCRSLGVVVGAERSSTLTPPEEHMQAAVTAATEDAAQRRASYLLLQQPQLQSGQYGVWGATVVGEAFFCPSIEEANAQTEAAERERLAAQQHARDETQRVAREQAAAKEAAAKEVATAPAKVEDGATHRARIVAENAELAKAIAANAPPLPASLSPQPADAVQVLRVFPTTPCSSLGEREARRTDASLVRAVEELRQAAAQKGANVVVLDPAEFTGTNLRLFARFYLCQQ